MIQGGDPNTKDDDKTNDGQGGPGYTVPAEFVLELTHNRGVIAAARAPDRSNPQKASNGSQFYIVENKEGYHSLDGNYTVFGVVIKGFETVEKIAEQKKDRRNRPLDDIKMTITIKRCRKRKFKNYMSTLTKLFFIAFAFIVFSCSEGDENMDSLVKIHTNQGDITVLLFDDTPLHKESFLSMAKEGMYDSTSFHRVINNFMIQGGHNKDGVVDPGYTIEAEILPNHSHKKGVLAAARIGGPSNPEMRSSGCQFYIVQNPNGTPHLDGKYTIYGEVIMGLDVVDKIAAVQTGRGDVPVKEITMTIEIED